MAPPLPHISCIENASKDIFRQGVWSVALRTPQDAFEGCRVSARWTLKKKPPENAFSTTRAEILVGIQLDSDWDCLLQLGI